MSRAPQKAQGKELGMEAQLKKKNGPLQEGRLWNLYYLVPELHQSNMSL